MEPRVFALHPEVTSGVRVTVEDHRETLSANEDYIDIGIFSEEPATGISVALSTDEIRCLVRALEAALSTALPESGSDASAVAAQESGLRDATGGVSRRCEYFMRDLGPLLIESALGVRDDDADDSDAERNFRRGQRMGFYQTISLLLSQADAFGLDPEALGLAGFSPERELLR